MYVLSADIFMKAIHYQMIIFVRFVNTEWQILSRYREKRIENKGGVEEIRLLYHRKIQKYITFFLVWGKELSYDGYRNRKKE